MNVDFTIMGNPALADMVSKLNDTLNELMTKLDNANALKDFRVLMMIYAEQISRELGVGSFDDTVRHALCGKLSICFELADRASQALAAKESQASDTPNGGIPDEL